MLESPKNPRVKELRRLRESRHRRTTGRFLVEGRRELARAEAAGLPIESLLVCEGALSPEEEALLERVRTRGAEILHLGPRAFTALAYRDPPEGALLAVAPLPGVPLATLEPRGDGPVLVLVDVEKPGNLGASLRSADGAGAAAVVVVGRSVDLGNPNLLRSSLGTLFTLPLAAATEEEARTWLAARPGKVLATSPAAAQEYFEHDLVGDVALVFGSEKDGLDAAWMELADDTVAIPMLGVADSLNLAQSVTLLLFEALRQRRVALRGAAPGS